MKSFWKWALIILGVLVVAFLIATPLFIRFGAGGASPMLAGARGGNGMLRIGFLLPAMLLGSLFFLSVPAALIMSIIALVRTRKPKAPLLPTVDCTQCGKPLQPEWQVCPHCGEKIKK